MVALKNIYAILKIKSMSYKEVKYTSFFVPPKTLISWNNKKLMQNLIVEARNAIVTLLSVTLAYFAPISDMVFVIFYLFLFNMLAGMIAGMVVNDEAFKLKKFFHCILETFVLYVIVLSVFCLGEKMHNTDGAMQCISGIVYAIVYFYSVNILRNLKLLLPDSRPISFLYYVVSFEIVKRIPYLQNFNEQKKDEPNK